MIKNRFKRYSLTGVLADGNTLTLDPSSHIVTLIDASGNVVEQGTLSPIECSLFVAILDNFPYHTPQDVLLSAYSGRDIEDCREQIADAIAMNNVDLAMHDVRNVLSNARLKLHMLGIELKAVVGIGYMLLPLKKESAK